ncbi:fatty acid cis/trans isomerase [Gallaecimonas mangrovi]|uniref:fatty acid cis/trans isomerase n=1 Tax=Gallaecimonas mangrovi TaxID=2291597 RepID=UPI000E208846|nr:fatty acid cis/trans isomerase [Gallaecimonas mangrovi]
MIKAAVKGRRWLWLALVILVAGCAVYTGMTLDQRYGKPEVQQRIAPPLSKDAKFYLSQVKPIIENRCVVCHACYDAPCQLKMSSPEGIDRGANKEKVYQGSRLIAANLTRLFVDAKNTEEWRQKGFYSVLNERDQTVQANTQAGVLARMLLLKQQHPLPNEKILDSSFDLSLNRDQFCPTIEEMPRFEQDKPLWGMPYAMPGLTKREHNTLMAWVKDGAKMAPHPALDANTLGEIERWEAFLNGDSLKARLVDRYIFEHLFVSHLYFADTTVKGKAPRFFNLVRSSTPPGQPVNVIATRRPFDDPGVSRVYYRFEAVRSTIVDKTHMPYKLDDKVMDRWRSLFYGIDYKVSSWPGYKPEVAANPLNAFEQLPIGSRYRFMLDNVENTIMGFIKGPVCRGQLALDVINDRFWVFFVDPSLTDAPKVSEFYHTQLDNLRMPAEDKSTTIASHWLGFAKRQGDYLRARNAFLDKTFKDGRNLNLKGIWDGDGTNQNATLTIFRHFDSATVVKGLVGKPPKTAWVIDYALLERIHYLLVAGFDVYGNYGHQLLTRLYMDFLRMEGESNFLTLLPPKVRHQQFRDWYKGAGESLTKFLEGDVNRFDQPSGVHYHTKNPKAELYAMLEKREAPVQPGRYRISAAEHLSANAKALLRQLGELKGPNVHLFPELTFIMVDPDDGGPSQLFTLARNSAHTNISSLFDEKANRDYVHDDVTLLHGLIGSYPGAFWHVKERDLAALVAKAQQVKDEKSYEALLDAFGVRRTNPAFWQFSDKLNRLNIERHPIEKGLLDYNRVENR